MTRAALISLLLSAALAALCLYVWPDMYERQRVDTVTITWKREIPAACGPNEKNGCAQWSDDRKRCVITTPATASDAILAHEIKHCFGWEHRE